MDADCHRGWTAEISRLGRIISHLDDHVLVEASGDRGSAASGLLGDCVGVRYSRSRHVYGVGLIAAFVGQRSRSGELDDIGRSGFGAPRYGFGRVCDDPILVGVANAI